MNSTERRAGALSSGSALPGAWGPIGAALAVALLFIVVMGGAGSGPTTTLLWIVLLVGLPFSTRYSLETLRRLSQGGAPPAPSRRIRKAVVLLALLVNAWVILVLAGYALIVAFSLLNGGPIVATLGFESGRTTAPEGVRMCTSCPDDNFSASASRLHALSSSSL